jgi:hypothetical protein
MDNSDLEEKPKKVLEPEYEILDGKQDENIKDNSKTQQGEYVDVLSSLRQHHFPFAIRILIFLTVIGIAVAALFAAVLALINTALAGILFFQNEQINIQMRKSWRNVGKLLVFTLGLIIAVFNPPFGFGIIVIYLMLRGENLNSSFTRMFYT